MGAVNHGLRIAKPARKPTLSMKVKLDAADVAKLHAIAAAIGSSRMSPEPTLHSLVVKAIKNFIRDCEEEGPLCRHECSGKTE